MNVNILEYRALTHEFYTDDFNSSEQTLTCEKVTDLISGTFSKIHVVQCSNDKSKTWVLKLPNQKGLQSNSREAQILKVLNAHEKLEGKEYLIQLIAFFALEIADLGLDSDAGTTCAPVMLFPHYQSDLFEFTQKNGVFPPNIAVNIAKQLLEITAFLEEQRLIHRDIKPENILIDRADDAFKIRLADFGAAIWENEEAETAEKAAGTLYSLSPELLTWYQRVTLTRPPYSFASDLWAIGCVLFDSISRSDLFAISSTLSAEGKAQKLTKLHKNFPNYFEGRLLGIAELDHYPVLENILKGTLNVDPKKRLSSRAGLALFEAPIESAS